VLHLFPNYKSHRKLLPNISKLRMQSVYSALSRLNSTMTKRQNWTENEVKELPSGEHDYFERKSGRLFEQNKGSFLDSLAKAVSAFANSGGGHILLGVEDDGTLDGILPQEGRATIKDWLEQKIPYLVDYALSDFRVHTVLPAVQSEIPPRRVIVVVDVGDSSLAPHQSSRDRRYYYRCAGRSELAPHFYLELLRQRLIHPALKLELQGLELEDAYPVEDNVFIEARLVFRVENIGRVAAYKWAVISMAFHDVPENRQYHSRVADYPLKRSRSRAIRMDDTILPGCVIDERKDLGVLLKPKALTEDEIFLEVKQCITSMVIECRIATETSPGEPLKLSMQGVVSTEDVTRDIMTKCQNIQVT